jgi:hypothetical protein
MELEGFCLLKRDADCKNAMGDPAEWQGEILMAMEINDRTKSVLLLKGAEMGMFDFKDVSSSFRCIRKGDVLIPHNLTQMEQLIYFSHVTGRNGGSNDITMRMVIGYSIHSGEFNDSVLWAKGQDPSIIEAVKSLKELSKNREN